MSFATHARRVRDHTLPYGLRRMALRGAVERHMPLGFTATWQYITGSVPLPQALEVLESSRAAWLREMAAFATRRRAQKQRGYGLRSDEHRYRSGFRWYGPDAHEAMYQTVQSLWTSRPRPYVDALAADISDCIRKYLLSGGQLTGDTRSVLRKCVAGVHQLPAVEPYRQLAKMAELVLHDALPLIRRGWAGDAVEVREVYLAATAAKPYLRKTEPDAGTSEWIDGFLACGRSHELWVAELRGRIVGFATLSPDQLGHLFVTPALRRQGIGTDLIVRAKRARPEGLRLHTFQRNTEACRFYERHGFTVSGFDDEPGEPDVTYTWHGRRPSDRA
ncbi:hypothetical protein Aph01nite_33570 [Acrocarpospora phusangensis]|uniref:N-acetyltransferase domain-containing protein n=1 Tax=Acrocarpospora phusangensis TaxID=1070424 RepID=A0A919QF06_9ACTN|nr:GNAT family N-acetyltransferase [Acrocarpospora phusangensis]GIH25047.1 hypothetical protein Aph01nite_33570 [Acrocarpospora phusangensis]